MEKNEWLAARRRCITGTDIAAICGLSRYASPMSVFMDKMGLTEPIPENEPMRWGKLLEPVIAFRYSELTGLPLKQGEFMVRDSIVGGTPDYLAPERLIEIKTAGIRSAKFWGEPGTDIVPDAYHTQVQWYLHLVGLDVADLAVLIGGQDYRVYTIERNQKLIDILHYRANDFWNKYVLPQEPPPLDATEASAIYLNSFFPRSKGNMARASLECHDLAVSLNNVRCEIDALEAKKTELENYIKLHIGELDGIESEVFKATWKSTKDSVKVNWESIAKKLNPPKELVEQFTVTKIGSRRFLFNYISE